MFEPINSQPLKQRLAVGLLSFLFCVPAVVLSVIGWFLLFASHGGEPGPLLIPGVYLISAGGVSAVLSAILGLVARRRNVDSVGAWLAVPTALAVGFLVFAVHAVISLLGER